MSENRRLRASVAVAAAAGVLLSLAAPADAAAAKRVAPVKVVASPTITNSTATLITFAFATSTTGVAYSCSLDGAKAAPCTSPSRYRGLRAGTHTLRVTATRTGYRSATGAASVLVDLTPPAAPTVSGLPTTATNQAVAPAFADASTDVASYVCSWGGGAFQACASRASIAPSPDGLHTIAVKAVDRAGNVSAASPTYSWIVDTTVAKPFITSGPSSPTEATTAAFSFGDADSDATFDCSIDAKSFTPCPTSYSGLGSSLAGTPHTFVVRATDPLGNQATSDAYGWTVMTSVPVTAAWSNVAGLPDAVTSARSATFGFATTGATSVGCRLDSTVVACTSPVAVSGLADGVHSFVVSASGSGTTVTLPYNWVVDATPPVAPRIYGPPRRTNATTASLLVVPSDLGDVVTCQLDGQAPAPCPIGAPVIRTGLADGLHALTVVETDRAGNATTVGYSWTVDTVPPVARITTPTAIDGFAAVTLNEDGKAAGTSPALTLSNGAAVATRRVCLSALGTAVACAGTAVRTVRLYGASPLVPGESYVVKVNAPGASPLTDAAGNAAPAVNASFRATLVQQETSPATTQTWRVVGSRYAKGGSFVLDGRPGATATWRFTGTAFTAYLVSGPTFGLARVYVDGVLRATWNQYASTARYTSAHTIKGLAARVHTVTVMVTGLKGSRAAKGADVGIDAFAAGAILQKTPALTMRWGRIRLTGSSGLYVAVDTQPGATFSMTFKGTGINWVHPVGPGFGLANVYVDGVRTATVDSFSASARSGIAWRSVTLTNARHSLRIVVLGTKRAASRGTTVSVDYLQVR